MLDTDTMVAAIRSESGASRRLLTWVFDRRFVMLASTSLMFEYEAVMSRVEHLDASGLSITDVGRLLDAVAAIIEPVRLDFHWRPILRDADDDMVLEAAINGRADAVVTFNTRDFAPAADRFGIAVIRPGAAIRLLET